MTMIDAAEFAERWAQYQGAPSGMETLGLYAVIGQFITNASLAEETTRKIARDILQQTSLIYKFRKTDGNKEKRPYRKASATEFEDSTQTVGEKYQPATLGYAQLIDDSRKALRQISRSDSDGKNAKNYLVARLNDADRVRLLRNSLAHGPILWFSGMKLPITLDRRRSHEKSDLGRHENLSNEDFDFREVLKEGVIANALAVVGAEAAIAVLWPNAFPGFSFPISPSGLVWPPDGIFDGLESKETS